jgi:predicted RNA-binding protein YlqC (UPF0109 family)
VSEADRPDTSGASDTSPDEGATAADGGQAAAVLSYVARQLVDDPAGVKVETSSDGRGVRLELFVAPGDMGKVIGRKGRIAQSIRAVVRATAAREGTHVFVDIVD